MERLVMLKEEEMDCIIKNITASRAILLNLKNEAANDKEKYQKITTQITALSKAINEIQDILNK